MSQDYSMLFFFGELGVDWVYDMAVTWLLPTAVDRWLVAYINRP